MAFKKAFTDPQGVDHPDCYWYPCFFAVDWETLTARVAYIGKHSINHTDKADDFRGNNEGITRDEFVNAVAAIDGLLKGLNPGVKTIIYKMLV